MKNEEIEQEIQQETQEEAKQETPQVKLSSPWIQYVNMILALFSEDRDIETRYDDDAKILRMLVSNRNKADSIRKLIPEEKVFGNVTLKIEVISSNTEETKADLIKSAFANNPFVSYIQTVDFQKNPMTYVVFKKVVLQYFNDDLSDINGNRTVLCQDIARELFEDHEGVSFCTDKE